MGGKLFITGISGFVGRKIAERALKMGYEVSGVDRTGESISDIDVAKADIRDKEAMLRLTKGMDYVIHVAAITSNLEFEKRLDFCYDVNVNGFNSVMEAAYRNKCKKLLYASSSAVYLDEWSENAVLGIHEQKNHYAKTKMINEMVGMSYADSGALQTIGMRYFNIYGVGEGEKGPYSSIISIYIRQLIENKKMTIYGSGKQARDLINVSDVAEITLRLLKGAKPGIYNVGTGKATSYNDIADMVSETAKKEHIGNPLATYQMLTKADTAKLLATIGNYKFKDIKSGVEELVSASGLKHS